MKSFLYEFFWYKNIAWKVGFSILFLAAALRILILSDVNMPFAFDHGKDSLATLHMISTWSPKLIGPWTSIPGVFFGPGWYYLIAPGLVLTQGHPIGPVIIMTILVLLQVWLLFRWFGWAEALIGAVGFSWVSISKSAWNPFPMTAVALLFFIIIKHAKENKSWSLWHIFGLCFVASLGFHFSAAFAFFYLLIIPVILLTNKCLRKISEWGAALLGGFLPFIPQFLFELRNNFVQTKALIAYFQENPEAAGRADAFGVIKSIFSETMLAIYPLSGPQPALLEMIMKWGILGLIVVSFSIWILSKNKEKLSISKELLIFVIIPVIGFTRLHYNIWYVLSLIPALTIFAGFMIRNSNKAIKVLFVTLMITGALASSVSFLQHEREIWRNKSEYFSVKQRATELIYQESNGQPFAVYTFASDIYDYSQQYMFFWQHLYKGRPLPTEFSYQPGETIYVKEKPELLAISTPTTAPAEHIFFWVESTPDKTLQGNWWGRQAPHEVIAEHQISPSLTIIHAKPKTAIHTE